MLKQWLTGAIEEYVLLTFRISMGNSMVCWLKQAEKEKTEQILMTCMPELWDNYFCGCYWSKNCSCWWSFKLKFKAKLTQKQLCQSHNFAVCLFWKHTNDCWLRAPNVPASLSMYCSAFTDRFSKSSIFTTVTGFLKSGFHWSFALIWALVWKSDSKTP